MFLYFLPYTEFPVRDRWRMENYNPDPLTPKHQFRYRDPNVSGPDWSTSETSVSVDSLPVSEGLGRGCVRSVLFVYASSFTPTKFLVFALFLYLPTSP